MRLANADAERYKGEPYVIAADVYASEQHLGWGGWNWYTGSASWLYRLGLEMILGLRREGETLRIQPCVPSDWPGYAISYRYGRRRYRIRVENWPGSAPPPIRITLDGELLPDERIPLRDDGQDHEVLVCPSSE